MKKIFTFLPFLLLALSVFAQAPQKMSYQAVIRNSSDVLVPSTVVGMRISILQGSATGTPVYVETQTPTTNTNGLVSIEIGGGIIVIGTMGGINWSTGAYFIKTETDPSGGANYTITGTSQLMSVPFALYAASSGNLATTGANVGDMQYWNGTSWTNIPVGKPGQIFQINAANIPEWSGSTIPTLTTNPVLPGEIDLKTASCGGTILNDGVNNQEYSITRGVCWSTKPHPTILNLVATSSSLEKTYTITMTGLEYGTTYYVRAFATNNTSTGYGNELIYSVPSSQVPILTTNPVTAFSNIDILHAYCTGRLLNPSSNTSEQIKENGICWSTSPNPTIDDFKFSYNNISIYVNGELSNLVYGTKYYVRTYAINNSSVIGYGNEVTYTPNLVVPIVTTTPVTNITGGTAASGGHILYEGGSVILQRGVCWSTSPNPTISDNKTSQENGNVYYYSNVILLAMNTTYYLRAYATNSAGAGYGDQVSFTTTSDLSLGAFYQGGRIGYIYNSFELGYVAGEIHGLIVATQDQGTAPWGCQNTLIGNTSMEVGSGNQNTINIVNACPTTGIAARLCADLVLNGYNDWFLPSYNEAAYSFRGDYLGIPNIAYWTSSEALYNDANTRAYDTQGRNPNKNELRQVRAVRKF